MMVFPRRGKGCFSASFQANLRLGRAINNKNVVGSVLYNENVVGSVLSTIKMWLAPSSAQADDQYLGVL